MGKGKILCKVKLNKEKVETEVSEKEEAVVVQEVEETLEVAPEAVLEAAQEVEGRQEEEWKPTTKLGRLVKNGKVTSFEEIFRFAIPIKEPQIVDHLVKKQGNTLKDEVMKVKPVQKQTKAGQRTRFKAWVLIGDEAGHIGLGQKAHKEVQGAIKGATLDAKMNFYPVRKGYWGNKIGQPHTVPFKVTGRCGSVRCRLVPAPRGSSLVAA